MQQKKEYLISKNIDDYFIGVSNAFKFVKRFLKSYLNRLFYFKEIVIQTYEIGIKF